MKNALLFKNLEKEDFEIVVDAMEIISVKSEDVVINEGDQGDCLYLVDRGILECTKVFIG